MNKLKKKAINFDLDTNKLKEFYPSKAFMGYKKAYKDIKKFFETHGFEHRQGSGYVSTKELDIYDANKVVQLLSAEFPWLKDCVKKFDITDIGKEWDLIGLIKGTMVIDAPEVLNQNSLHKNSAEKPKPLSFDERLAIASKKAKEINEKNARLEHKPHIKSKDDDLSL